MADKYQNRYRISSARLQAWDYSSNAAYFITICTAKRKHYFGQIINGKMDLSEQGKLANQFWAEITNHFSFVFLDEFIVMPNHVHGIIIIDNPGNNIIENVTGNLTGDEIDLSNISGDSNDLNVETGHVLSLNHHNHPITDFATREKIPFRLW